jgi:thiamine biosynthesis lipoprotein
MGITITLLAVPGPDGVEPASTAMDAALADFAAIDRHCTRFDADSDLMAASRAGEMWHQVGAVCFAALLEAAHAYRDTAGRFDPRVHDDLVRLGYDRSRRFGPMSTRAAAALAERSALPPWTPEFRPATFEVRVGPHPVDLGGIGKGLAVRAAAGRLAPATAGFLIDAGGDCWCGGSAPDGGTWRIAVEDPAGSDVPAAVLALSNQAVATSSTRVCSWSIGARAVHHLIDPTNGLPGGEGLAAVTVVGDDSAAAEVLSKTLFLAGSAGIAAAARRADVAAMWISTNGDVAFSPDLAPFVVWQRR